MLRIPAVSLRANQVWLAPKRPPPDEPLVNTREEPYVPSDGCQVVQVEVEAEAEDSGEEGAMLVDAVMVVALVDAVMVVAPHVSAQAQRRQPGASLMASLPQVPCPPIASRLAIRSGAPPPF